MNIISMDANKKSATTYRSVGWLCRGRDVMG